VLGAAEENGGGEGFDEEEKEGKEDRTVQPEHLP